MAHADVNGARIFYREQGPHAESADEHGAPVVFAHGLLMSHRMFDAQVEALSHRHRCVAYDHRGQGDSDDGGATELSMDLLAEDAAALIERLDCAPCHFVGLSMGGFVGMRLAARRPELVRTLTLLATSADPEPPSARRTYRAMAAGARVAGVRPLVGRVQRTLMGEAFLTDPSRAEEVAWWREHLAGRPRSIHRAVRGVVDRDGVVDELDRIAAPCLVVTGEEDVATPPERAERIHQRVADSKLVRIPRAGHSPTIEAPTAVTVALEGFLADRG